MGWTFYLHRFVDSDPDRGLHDHPWRRSFSILLNRPYLEHTRYGVKLIRFFNVLNGTDLHRVVLRDRRPVWTLFGHGPDVKTWGFLRFWDYEEDRAIYQYRVHARSELAPGDKVEWWVTNERAKNHVDRLPINGMDHH